MEKPQRKTSILNLEKKKSSDLCRTTSPVMSRKKSRRKSSVKAPPVAEPVKEVKQEMGLNFAKRKESMEKEVDENPTRRRSRHRKSTSSKAPDPPLESVVEHREKTKESNSDVFENGYHDSDKSTIENNIHLASQSSFDSDSTTSCIDYDGKVSSDDNQKTGASYEELLNTIDKEFGQKEFFTRSKSKMEFGETNETETPQSGEFNQKETDFENETDNTTLVNGFDNHKENNVYNDFSKPLVNNNPNIDEAISETKHLSENNSRTNEVTNKCEDQHETASEINGIIPSKNEQSKNKVQSLDKTSDSIENEKDVKTKEPIKNVDTNSKENDISLKTKEPINDENQKKVFRKHFGVGRRPSKPWQPAAKSTNLEFGISYVK